MLTAEPSLEIPLPVRSGTALVYSGVGITYDVLFGPDFDTFDNFGFKVRPIAFQRKGWGLAYNIRFYADDFGRDLFNRAPPVVGDRPKEIIHTISLTIPY
jgi:hypothetical protein